MMKAALHRTTFITGGKTLLVKLIKPIILFLTFQNKAGRMELKNPARMWTVGVCLLGSDQRLYPLAEKEKKKNRKHYSAGEALICMFTTTVCDLKQVVMNLAGNAIKVNTERWPDFFFFSLSWPRQVDDQVRGESARQCPEFHLKQQQRIFRKRLPPHQETGVAPRGARLGTSHPLHACRAAGGKNEGSESQPGGGGPVFIFLCLS